MTIIMVDVLPETERVLHSIAAAHPSKSFAQAVGEWLDAHAPAGTHVRNAPESYREGEDFPSGSVY